MSNDTNAMADELEQAVNNVSAGSGVQQLMHKARETAAALRAYRALPSEEEIARALSVVFIGDELSAHEYRTKATEIRALLSPQDGTVPATDGAAHVVGAVHPDPALPGVEDRRAGPTDTLVGADQPTNRALPPALDRETIQTLLDLLNPLHGSLDNQVSDQITDERELDAPPDREYAANVTAQQERDLTQAVKILENRLRDPQYVAQPTNAEPCPAPFPNDCCATAEACMGRAKPTYAMAPEHNALKLAVSHIEHMAAWIGKQNAGYSFESLGEDMPGIRAAMTRGDRA